MATCFGATAFSVHVAQPSHADLQQFVGTWQARFKGKIFETIKLEKQQGKLTGTASLGDIQLDKDGELTSAHEVDGSDPIVEATVTGGILRITTKESSSRRPHNLRSSSPDPIRWSFGCSRRLTSPLRSRGSWSERRVVNKT
jgi:hypothetical protein